MDTYVQVIITSITGGLTFLLGLRRGKADTENVLLQNLEKSIGIYQLIIEDMKEEIKSLNVKIDTLEGKVEQLLQENNELKTLMREHDALTNSKK